MLTSTNGHGTTNVYTDFSRTGTEFAGAASTLVCPSNDLSQCKGDDAPVISTSITPSGTVNGANVRMTISFPSTAGADTVTMVGTAAGTSLGGTYTDTLGDAGTWNASVAKPLSSLQTVMSVIGPFNPTAHPLTIVPTIAFTLAQDLSLNLTGTATITNSPCATSLTLSGQAVGGAFSVNDATSKIHIVAVPSGNGFAFTYNFDPTAPNCPGDSGGGALTSNSPYDY